MNNIFKDAKFGDKFLTRDGRTAVFIRHYKDSESADMFYLIVEGSMVTYVWTEDGKIAPNYNNDSLDIVSKYILSYSDGEIDDFCNENIHEKYYYTHDEKGIEDFSIGFKSGFKTLLNHLNEKQD